MASQDSVYKKEPLPALRLVNADDDVHGVAVELIEPVTDVLHEAAPSTGQPFTIVLHSEPIADVVVTMTVSDPTVGAVQPPRYTFTPNNWDTKATFVVYVTHYILHN